MDYFVQLRVITRAFIRGRQDHREERLDVRIRGEVGMISLGDKGLHKPEHGQPFPLEKARKMDSLLELLERVKSSVQFNRSVMSDSATPWTVTDQAFLSVTNFWSLLNSRPLSQ